MHNKRFLVYGFLISTLHFIICSFSGIFGWPIQMIIVPAISCAVIFIAYFIISKNLFICLLLIAPFYIVYTSSSIYLSSFQTYPIWGFGFLLSLLTYLLLKNRIRYVILIPLLVFLIVLGWIIIWPNTFSYLNQEEKIDRYNLINSKIVDENEKEVDISKLQGKVVLFDIWHSACIPCIKQFPEIQKLHEYYYNDTTVLIVSLNFPLEKDHNIRPFGMTSQYSFTKMYFLNEAEYQKFSVKQVPLILIMDKNQKCRYAGELNTSWNIFFGNAKKIINKLKNE